MRQRSLGLSLLLLAAGVAAVPVLGPVGLGVLQHRTSPTTLNQLIGVDVVSVVLVAPLCVAIGLLAWRRHPAAPVLALAPAAYAVYTSAQVILGQEHLQHPGNVEHFFPLLLAVFVLGGGITVAAWTAIDVHRLPAPSRRLERLAGVVLLLVAAFLVLGLHLPSLLDALGGAPTSTELRSSPTAFWVVKLMDLGIIVPSAIATGVGLLRRHAGARRAAYAILGGYTLLAWGVTAMGAVMVANGDPDASVGLVVGFGGFAAAFTALTGALYRPLLRRPPRPLASGADRAPALSAPPR
jgi:hypothetical protein